MKKFNNSPLGPAREVSPDAAAAGKMAFVIVPWIELLVRQTSAFASNAFNLSVASFYSLFFKQTCLFDDEF